MHETTCYSVSSASDCVLNMRAIYLSCLSGSLFSVWFRFKFACPSSSDFFFFLHRPASINVQSSPERTFNLQENFQWCPTIWLDVFEKRFSTPEGSLVKARFGDIYEIVKGYIVFDIKGKRKTVICTAVSPFTKLTLLTWIIHSNELYIQSTAPELTFHQTYFTDLNQTLKWISELQTTLSSLYGLCSQNYPAEGKLLIHSVLVHSNLQ